MLELKPKPRHIEYWITSDGRSFDTLERAENWEKIISSPEYNMPLTNSVEYNSSKLDLFEEEDEDTFF